MNFKEAEETAKNLVQSPKRPADSMLLIDLHKTLIGDKPKKWYCATCTGKMDAVFWDLRLKYFSNSKSNTMAKSSKSTKYQFSTAATKNGVTEIVLINDGRTETIRPETLTDAQAKRILADKNFAHNIEEIGATSTASTTQDAPKKTAKKGTKAATTPAGAVAGNQEPHEDTSAAGTGTAAPTGPADSGSDSGDASGIQEK